MALSSGEVFLRGDRLTGVSLTNCAGCRSAEFSVAVDIFVILLFGSAPAESERGGSGAPCEMRVGMEGEE